MVDVDTGLWKRRGETRVARSRRRRAGAESRRSSRGATGGSHALGGETETELTRGIASRQGIVVGVAKSQHGSWIKKARGAESLQRTSEKNEGSLDEEDGPFLLTGHEPLARPA